MKAQHLMLKDRIEVLEIAAKIQYLPPGSATADKKYLPKITVALVILAHLGLIAAAITHTTQYRPLDIINPAEHTSVEVTMVEAPQPVEPPPLPRVTDAPMVLSAENSEREEVVPVPVPVPEVKPITPPPKPQPKPKIVSKPKPAQEKTARLQNAKVSDQAAIPATSRGEMLKSVPHATPKTVATVGCQVPAPAYPRKAKRLQEEGEVLIRLVINANGTLGRSDVARSSGHEDLDQAAMAAVSRIRCNPYLENGQAISVMTVQPITFKLSR
ncbi:energy transducer TonB [Pantoea agglomerans]|nr:energy transducer TonB [Pantoea agglomerans]